MINIVLLEFTWCDNVYGLIFKMTLNLVYVEEIRNEYFAFLLNY